MEFFTCKSESEAAIKVIMALILWGIPWLYRHLTASDGSTSNKDEVEDEVEDTPLITPIPITSKVERKTPQPAPFPQTVAAKPQSSPLASSIIEQRKSSWSRKRKLFRDILLVDALMQRKDFIA